MPPQLTPSSPEHTISIVPVRCNGKEPPLLKQGVAELFQLYFDELLKLGCDLGMLQGFQSEWDNLPGKYDFLSRGGLFVVITASTTASLSSTDEIVGCIALRPLEGCCGEIRRLFLRQEYRRQGIGKQMTQAIVEHAWKEGYQGIKLESFGRLVWLQDVCWR